MDNLKRASQKSKSLSPIHGDNDALTCEVILLDPTQQNYKVILKGSENGSILFNKVCETLGGILEKDYFGLKYIDKHGQQQWLELNKPTHKQVKDKFHKKSAQLFSFRFKHYPKDPNKDLQQDLSKYLLYLQLRRDLFRGRLVGLQNDQCSLAALVVQAEIGGFDMVDLDTIKIGDLKILPYINRKSETKIMTIYETFKHLDCQEAERLFLDEASKLETYGVEPVAVKDQKGNDLFVGITYDGISTFGGSKKVHTFPWQNIIKLSFSHKMFMFQVMMEQKKHILGFKCETSHASCALWKWALDRKDFFTLDKASEASRSTSGGSLFRRKKSHIFAGRSQREITKSCQSLQIIPQPHVIRAQSMMALMKCSNSRSESANINEKRLENGYATLPRSQGKKTYLSDSSDDAELSKETVKENGARTKPTSAAVGAVLDFMQALMETPILQRSISKQNIPNTENSSRESDGMNNDDDSTFLSEMNELVKCERVNLMLNREPNFNESAPLESSEDISTITCDSPEIDGRSMTSSVIISVLVLCISIFLGIATVVYVHEVGLVTSHP